MKRRVWMVFALGLGLAAIFVLRKESGSLVQVSKIPKPAITLPDAPPKAVQPALPASSGPTEILEEFAQWVQRRRVEGTPASAQEVARGESLAKSRREIMANLITNDPQRAVEMAIPPGLRQQLPSSVAQHLEEWVSGRGDYTVLVATDFETMKSDVRREAVINGKQYDAFVYGRRVSQTTRANIPMHGPAIGKKLALAENPVRQLSQNESAPAGAESKPCPVSQRPANTYGSPVVGEIAGKYESFCGARHLELYNGQLAGNEGTTGNGDEPPLAQESWSQGPKTLLYMRVAFPDDPNEPITEAAAYTAMDTVNAWYVENSYDTTAIITTVTPLLIMPQTKAWYSEQGTGRLMTDSREAARALGYDTDNYHWDICRHNSVPGFSYGGLASVHGKGTWLQSSGVGVTIHELGHNYGIWHANFWNPVGDSVYGIGIHSEYGDPFDPMGSANGGIQQFNAAFKSQLDWLSDGFVQTVTNSGTYRIYTYDIPNLTPGLRYALKVGKNYDRNYWAEFRQKYTTSRWFNNGVLLHWDPWNNGVTNSGSGTHLLDTTPGTPDGKNDCPVVIGRTFTDVAAGVHITPVAKGNGSPENWIDLVVNVGTFTGNRNPVSSLTSDRTTASIGNIVNFSAVASDPDGDALAYAWDFGDLNFGANSPNVSKSWTAAGNYVVRCTVSDMKGGIDTRQLLVTIGAPGTFRVSGRILTDEGSPLEGVRVHNSLSGTSYRGTYTDSAGNYVLPNLAAGSHTVAAVKHGYTFVRDSWTSPVTVGPNADNLNWTATAMPTVNIAATDANAGESGANSGTFTLTRTGPLNVPLLVKMNRSGAAAAADATLSPAPAGTPLQITMPVGVGSIDITVNPVNDGLSEGPELLKFTLMEDPAYILASLAEATVTIADDEAATKPTVDVSASSPSALADNSAPESGSDAGVFTFTRTGSTAGELTIFYTVSGTASNGVDFDFLPGVVTIPAGETVTAVRFQTIDDLEVEGDETVIVTVSANAAYNGGGDNTSVTIVDDDLQMVSVTPTDNIATETSGNPGTFTITRVGNLDANLVVNYTMVGSAEAGVDYNNVSGTVTILAGRPTATVTITPINDLSVEGQETVILSLLSSPAYNVSIPGEATVLLQDNEIPTVTLAAADSSAPEPGTETGNFFFARGTNITGALTVHFQVQGTAINGIDYTAIPTSILIPDGNSNATIIIRALNDSVKEDSERVTLRLLPDAAYNIGTVTPPSVTIADDDGSNLPGVGFTFAATRGNESVTTVRLSVSLSSATYTSPVGVNFAVTGGTAGGSGLDYTLANGSLSFTDGEINRTISLTVNNDVVVETNETIQITLSNPSNAALDAQTSHTYTILDDDASGVVSVVALDPNASESGDPGSFRISRTVAATNALTVNYEVVGSASAPTDYESIGRSVTIPANSTTVTIPVLPVDDETDETAETVILKLTTAPGARLGSPVSATVTITDNDNGANLPVVSIIAIDSTASEPGADTGTFRLSRDRDFANDLAVSFTVGGTASTITDYTPIGTSATIPAGESNVVITVTPLDDPAFESNETVVVTLTILSAYRAALEASATVTIVDNETGVSVTSNGSTAEDGSSAGTFTISRTGSVLSDLVVNFTVGGTATRSNDYQSFGTTAIVPAGTNAVTISATAVNDAQAEGNETIVLTLAAGAGYTVQSPNSATVLIVDDEPAISIIASDATATEAGSNAGVFTLSRSGSTNGELTVDLLIAGTAENGVDYESLTNTVILSGGQSLATIHVLPINDADIEGNESVSITVLSNANYAVLAPSSAVVTIVDDEINLPPQVSITRPAIDQAYVTDSNLVVVLEATASDDGNPPTPGTITTTWTVQSGPNGVTFADIHAVNTTARFPTNGAYVLRLTADDSQLAVFREVTINIGPMVSQGLQAYWRLDETNGTLAVDSSGLGRHGTVGGATWTRAGRVNYGLDFDGVDDRVSFSSPAMLQFSLSAWMWSDSMGDSTTPRIIAMPGYNVRIRRDSASTDDAVAMESQRSAMSGEWRTPGDVVFDGGWYHVVVTYDSSSTANAPTFYVNGVNQPSTVRTPPSGTQLANNGTGYIGNAAALDRSFDGRLDEIRLYNRILTPAEVQTLYSSPSANTAPLVDAGPDRTVALGDAIYMEGSVTDDGKPLSPGTVANVWSKFSGPGTVEFADEQSEASGVTFSQPGIYVLRLTSDDSEIKVLDEVTYTVTPPPVTTVIVEAFNENATEATSQRGAFLLTRTGQTNAALSVRCSLLGTASNGVDYATINGVIIIPAGAESVLVEVIPAFDSLVEGDETVTLLLQPAPSYEIGNPGAATVVIHDRPWDAWRAARFTSQELGQPEVSGETADPDGDLSINLAEYAHNTEPKEFAVEHPLKCSVLPGANGDYFVVRFTRRLVPTDLLYQLEVTRDFQTWLSGPNAVQELPPEDDGNGETETAVYRVHGSVAAGHHFVRLRLALSNGN